MFQNSSSFFCHLFNIRQWSGHNSLRSRELLLYLSITVITTLTECCKDLGKNTRCPCRATVYKNVRKYSVSGTSCNLNKGRSGHQKTASNAANIEAVRNAIEEANEELIPGGMRITCRRNGLGLSSATFNRITSLDFRFHPYQMIKRHQLFPGDYPRRAQFCQWLLEQDGRFLEDVVIGDEAEFSLNASVNNHNIREYLPRGEQPLNFQYLRNDGRHKLSVWVGLMGNGTVTGPFFFRQNIDGDDYLRLINEEVFPALQQLPRYRGRRNDRFQRLWWLQDGAPCHRRRAVTDRLTELFGKRAVE